MILDRKKLMEKMNIKGKNLTWLINALPCARSSIWYWSNDKIPLKSARAIANLLECDVCDITK